MKVSELSSFSRLFFSLFSKHKTKSQLTKKNNINPSFSKLIPRVSIQVYKVGTISHMWDEVILKIGKYTINNRWGYYENWKVHHNQVFYHAYFTYIQASNQAKRGSKPTKKAQNSHIEKNKLKNINKTSGHLTPTPKLHNVLIMETKAPKSNGISKPTANPTQIHQILAHLCHHQQHKINK